MLPSIVCKMMIKYIFYIIYFYASVTFLIAFDNSYNQKSIDNLKNTSEILINNKNFDLALDVYLKILEFERNIYSEHNIEIAQTYDKIASLYIALDDYQGALPYLKKSINVLAFFFIL